MAKPLSEGEETPKVSVVMATYQQQPVWLMHAIQSALVQELPPHEVIVVTLEDDQNLPVLQTMRQAYGDMLRVVISKKANPYHQRNVGMQRASGEFITFLDSDDLYLPNKLWLETHTMQEKDAMVVYTGFFYADARLNIFGSYKHEGFSLAEMRKKCCITDYALIRRRVWEEIGWMDVELQSAAVYDAMLRIVEKYEDRIIYRKVPTWLYRQRKGQLSQAEALDPSQLERRNEAIRRHYARCGEEPPEGSFATGPNVG